MLPAILGSPGKSQDAAGLPSRRMPNNARAPHPALHEPSARRSRRSASTSSFCNGISVTSRSTRAVARSSPACGPLPRRMGWRSTRLPTARAAVHARADARPGPPRALCAAERRHERFGSLRSLQGTSRPRRCRIHLGDAGRDVVDPEALRNLPPPPPPPQPPPQPPALAVALPADEQRCATLVLLSTREALVRSGFVAMYQFAWSMRTCTPSGNGLRRSSPAHPDGLRALVQGTRR